EGLLVSPLQGVDPLLILPRAERRYHQRLGFAASEQRGAVRARQHSDLAGDGTPRLHVATIDAMTGIENVPAHNLGFDLFENVGDLLRGIGRVVPALRAK